MKVIVINEDDYKEAFAKALDVLYEGEEHAGSTMEERFVDGLLIAAFSAVLQKFLFEIGEQNNQLDVKGE